VACGVEPSEPTAPKMIIEYDPTDSSRALANTAAERARKAVTARIRDAIYRITHAHPELGAHPDRAIRTGTTCRYESSPRD
jgi:hypothetical protein